MGQRLVPALILMLAGCGEGFPPTSPPGDMVVVFPVIDLAMEAPPDLAMAPDLAIVTHKLSFAPEKLLVILTPRSVVVGDFDKDGNLDLVANDLVDESVGAFLGDGMGGFKPLPIQSAGPYTLWIDTVDLDGDGNLDLVNGNLTNNSFDLLAGKGNGTFAPPTSIGTPQSGASQLAVGDIDHDGVGDVAFVDGDVVQLFGLHQGQIVAKSKVPFSVGEQNIALVDVNGDKRLDLLASGSGMQLALGHGDGTFAPPTMILPTNGEVYGWADAGDLDGDHHVDLAVVAEGTESVATFLGNGQGGFTAGPTLTPFNQEMPSAVALADFDGDGTLDLAVVGLYGTIDVFSGDGKGGWKAAPFVAAPGSLPTSLVVGDFNSDGKPDLAIADRGDNHIRVLINTSM
jgi:hypothetical protein